jgi:glycosyltransferase involved in cell wall biosynthesis
MNAQLILALDDNLLDLRAERADWPTEEHEAILRWLLEHADGVLVSSAPLAERLAGMNDNIAILPNALDERLLGRPVPAPMIGPFGRRPISIGYMGTPTHDDDLRMILPALRIIAERYPDQVVFEFIGVMRQRSTREALAGLPVRFASPRPQEQEYPLFMPWYTHRMAWDIAIAPLRDTPFRRCKSDVKFLDACALGSATVCSDVAAYSGTVQHGETGLLVPNTTEAWVADKIGQPDRFFFPSPYASTEGGASRGSSSASS